MLMLSLLRSVHRSFVNPSIPMNPFKFSLNKALLTKFHALIQRPNQALAVLGLGLLVAACGGGGGSATPAAAPTPTAADAEVVTIQSGVLLYDGVAGFLRMLDLAGVVRLTGQAGLVSVACPGGGSLQTNKLAVPIPTLVSGISTVFTMTANQCRFSSRDGLVYNGVWAVEALSSGSITYSSSGACAATCNGGRITVRTANAAYGYGVADNQAPQVLYDLLTTNNSHRFSGFLSGESLTAGSPRLAVFAGNQTNTLPLQGSGVAFEGSLQVVDSVSGPIGTVVAINGTRDTLKITTPFKAALQVSDAGVAAVVDSYGTTAAHTSTIPWSAFLD